VLCRPAESDRISSVPVDSGRADLMAAIRGFEKNRLSRAGERKVKKKKKHEDSVDSSGKGLGSGSGGDLMSDLARQLSLRRKGIQ